MIMEYQKIINLFHNMPDQSHKFRTKNWVEINDESKEWYSTGSDIKFKTTILSTGSDIKFKTTMLRSNLCSMLMYNQIKFLKEK